MSKQSLSFHNNTLIILIQTLSLVALLVTHSSAFTFSPAKVQVTPLSSSHYKKGYSSQLNSATPSTNTSQENTAEEEEEFKKHIKQLCNERNFPFEKVKNARDLSSAVKAKSTSTSTSSIIQPGRIIRTGRVSDATPNDLNILNNQIGVKTLVDLRSYTELKDDPTLDRKEVFSEYKDLVWDERKNSVKLLNEGRSRVETKRNIVSHVKELMSGAKKGVEVATHSIDGGDIIEEESEGEEEEKDTSSEAAEVGGILKVLSSAADLAEATDACEDGDCGDVVTDTIYENQEDNNASSKRFVKTYKCDELFNDQSRSNDKERHFVAIMNELKYVKGTLGKVRKRDLAKVIMKSPGAIVSKRVRSSCKSVFLDKINAGGLILLNELLLVQAAPGIKHVLDLCKDRTRHPIAFYCTAGKDRTGAIAAIMLAAAGIPDEDIIEDYSLSANVYAEMNDHKAMVGALSQRSLDAKTFLGAPPEVMKGTLENIRESYGSIEGYLDSIGFDEQDRKELRSALLDE